MFNCSFITIFNVNLLICVRFLWPNTFLKSGVHWTPMAQFAWNFLVERVKNHSCLLTYDPIDHVNVCQAASHDSSIFTFKQIFFSQLITSNRVFTVRLCAHHDSQCLHDSPQKETQKKETVFSLIFLSFSYFFFLSLVRSSRKPQNIKI